MYIFHNDFKIELNDNNDIISLSHKDAETRTYEDGTPPVSVMHFNEGIKFAGEGCGIVERTWGGVKRNLDLSDSGVSFSYNTDCLNVNSDLHFTEGSNVIYQTNRIKNTTDSEVVLRHVSSTYLPGLDRCGKKCWYDKDKFKVHFARYSWGREAQWYEFSILDLGICPSSDLSIGNGSSYRLSSNGTWSTSRYYPIIILEDTECGQCYFAELLGPTNWAIEIGLFGDRDCGIFYIEANSSDYISGGWKKTLKKGEEYVSVPAIFGCVRGGFEEAVRELNSYKRKNNNKPWPKGYPYLCFNDYMNCLWGKPTDKNSIPLIDAAAEMGAEVYCMDAGWYADKGSKKIGDWIWNDDLFGGFGFAGIINYIKSKGMIPGIWTELECIQEGTVLYEKGLYLRCEDGTPLKCGGRYFADLTNTYVRKFLKDAVRRLYDLGIRYIKNDYNASTVNGVSVSGSSNGEGNNLLAEATRSFYKELSEEFDGLILENCGSGAMRSDFGILSDFTLQSTSDECCYQYYPSIISGSVAVMPPEKAGIWCYPYPVRNNPNLDKFPFGSDEYKNFMADGEETVFNMVNGLMGCMYLSGRIDEADAINKSLIHEGTDVFKKYRCHTADAYPVWPCGRIVRNDPKNTALGLLSKSGDTLTLAVWRLSADNSDTVVDLSKYGTVSDVELVYPQNTVKTEYTVENNILRVTLPVQNSARLFEIKLVTHNARRFE